MGRQNKRWPCPYLCFKRDNNDVIFKLQLKVSKHHTKENFRNEITQLTFTSSKSTMETVEKSVKYLQS